MTMNLFYFSLFVLLQVTMISLVFKYHMLPRIKFLWNHEDENAQVLLMFALLPGIPGLLITGLLDYFFYLEILKCQI